MGCTGTKKRKISSEINLALGLSMYFSETLSKSVINKEKIIQREPLYGDLTFPIGKQPLGFLIRACQELSVQSVPQELSEISVPPLLLKLVIGSTTARLRFRIYQIRRRTFSCYVTSNLIRIPMFAGYFQFINVEHL